MELLERQEFFGELEAILSDVAAGIGRFVLVSGEAGIGKTFACRKVRRST